MIRVYAVYDAPILLGRNGEHDTREVVFNISDWLNDYGEGYAQLAVHRHDEEDYYLVPLITDKKTVIWRVTGPDVGVVGQGGECELSWYSNSGAFVKSQTWRTTVLEALNGEQVDAPDVTKAWLDAAREQAAETQRAADEAKKSEQKAAASARVSAESARAARDAVGAMLEAVEVRTVYLREELEFVSEDAEDSGAAFYYRTYGAEEDCLRLIGLEPGVSYAVNWEDSVYTCTAADISDTVNGSFAVKTCVALGNRAKLSAGYEDTGEPFLVYAIYLEETGGRVLSQNAYIKTHPGIAAKSVTRDVKISEWGGFVIRDECLPDVKCVTDTVTLFALSDSPITPPTDGWSEIAPAWMTGKYLWQKIILTYSDGTMKTSSCVCLSGAGGQSGEDATTLLIDSTHGTVFKNSAIATDLNVTVYKGAKPITTLSELKSEYGSGAYLEWSWKRLSDKSFGVILVTDSRISNDGFTFTISAGEVDTKVVLKCQLII